MKRRAFISNAIDEEKIPFSANDGIKFGRAHYSWKIIADLYTRGLESANLEVNRISRPEIYQSAIAKKIFGARHDDFHLAIKPIEHIRPFYGIKNIFVCGWEFPEFSSDSFTGNPFFNQTSILKHAEQIWCWSDFTTNNLLSHGIKSAITLSPPVIIPKFLAEDGILDLNVLALNTTRPPAVEDTMKLGAVLDKHRNGAKFLSVLNPWDKRKQLHLMLDAFQKASQEDPSGILIIKLVIDNIATTLGDIQRIVRDFHKIEGQCDNIVFIGESLSDSQMVKLMQTVDFYLCTSSTEGLNLPLIEAMSQGTVPISTRATAMADYISNENSIVLESVQSKTDGPYHALHQHMSTTHFPPILSSIVNALLVAASLSDASYKKLSTRAKEVVNEKYSIPSFVEKLRTAGLV